MRDIAIVGSGISGLAAAHGFLRAGNRVELYSDRTPAQWLNESRPTGTAARFALALSYERELGLDFWNDVAPKGEGVYLTFCPTLHNKLVKLIGRTDTPFQAVDVRLQAARWMEELERRGGRVVIEPVSVERLDAIAASHDLTIVATGRADLCRLFPRDDARSVHSAPQRKLAMVIVTGAPSRFDDCPLVPVKFELLGTDGEVFIVPYFHKDHGPSWNLVFEAKPGSRMDRFGDARTGEEAVDIARRVLAELFPWDEPFARNMRLADPNGWLVGAVAPTVRQPFAQLSSGRIVAALGDTSISFDPIAAQGANNAIKQARWLVEAVTARGEAPLDARFLGDTFDAYFDEHARHAYRFSNLLLEPITPAAQELLIAQYGSDGRLGNRSGKQKIADVFFANFCDPRLLTDAFTDVARARRVIAELSGPWLWNGVRGRMAIARDQVKQRLA